MPMHLATDAVLWQGDCMRIRNLNHSRYQHEYHIVWGTKYRRKYLKPYVKGELLNSFFNTCKVYPTLYISSANVDQDHVHMQIEIASSMSVAQAVQLLKGRSSAHLKRMFGFIRDMYEDGSIWSVGYFSSTIGLNEQTIRKYIEEQGMRDFGENQSSFEFS